MHAQPVLYWDAGIANNVFYKNTSSFIPTTDAAYQAWLSAGNAPTKIIPADLTLLRIEWLEASVTNRRLREAILGVDNGWLKSINDQIVALRGT